MLAYVFDLVPLVATDFRISESLAGRFPRESRFVVPPSDNRR